MTTTNASVEFEPHGRIVRVDAGCTLLEAAKQAGLTLDTPCGGSSTCGKCRVRVTSGVSEATTVEEEFFSAAELKDGWRLACATPASGRMMVFVPEGTLLSSHHQILTDSDTAAVTEHDPVVRKQYLELPLPTMEDSTPDLERIQAAMEGVDQISLPMLRMLPEALRAAEFKGTAVVLDGELIAFEPGDTTAANYGLAYDIGTTTMAGILLDLNTGEELAVVSRMNPQTSFGDDVLSRIAYATENVPGLKVLHEAVMSDVAAMALDCCEAAEVASEQVYSASFSGNTTMEHLLCGIDPRQLGMVPFTPAFSNSITCGAEAFGLPIHPRGRAHIFPVVGGFVGGDTVAGILTTHLVEREGPVLMIDIGTNGEIVLAHEGRLYAASTAAGPAFEGARISCGMRATRGAIERVVLDGDLEVEVIDNAPATGLCGSGLIDLVAELLRRGLMGTDGKLRAPEELPEDLSDALKDRVHMNGSDQLAFLLASAEDSGHGHPVTLEQQDIRELQLAGGAIRAGIKILLKQAGLALEDVKELLIAGGFGSFIRRENAWRIGLFPREIPLDRVHYVGNTALAGARQAVCSESARRRADELAAQVEHVELSADMDFAMEFAMAMTFPEAEQDSA